MDMAKIFRTTLRRRNPATGKLENAHGADGAPIRHPKWRVTLLDHKGRRKTYTLSTNKLQSQKQADLLELREREIRNGVRSAPEPEGGGEKRSFNDVLGEYMAWGRCQGGRNGLPWDDEHAVKKERELILWKETLGLETIGDAEGVLPKVEAACRELFAAGNSGKTVSNRIQHLRAIFLWCCRRGYLNANPLAQLGRFNIQPTYVRRAMTIGEYRRLIRSCSEHRRLLYEVAVLSGLRENELKQLEPKHLDRENMAIRVDRMIDKGRIARLQPVPASLMDRLTAFAESKRARKLYAQYRRQKKKTGKAPPENPLLYVPYNAARSLRKDLLDAGIPFETPEGRLDFHALRTGYVNFLMDAGAAPKELQDLARHKTLEMTMNIYGRSRQDRKRELVETLGRMLADAPERTRAAEDAGGGSPPDPMGKAEWAQAQG